MMKQKQGRIINISSVAGKKGWKNATAYCATKFALTGFTQALNEEGKPYNICCSVIVSRWDGYRVVQQSRLQSSH